MPRILAAIFFLLAAAPALAAEGEVGVATILCYHEVDPAGPPVHATIPRLTATGDPISEQLRYTAPPERFTAQLDYLQEHGYHVIPLAELVDFLNGKGDSLPPKAVVITVDDGWLCSYQQILPELRRRGMPFTLFVYPSVIGHGSHVVTWSQVAKMAREGVDIESHTFTHPFLAMRNNSNLTLETYPQFLEHELLDSKKLIEQQTQKPIRFLSYPFGDFDSAVVDAAARYDYQAAVTTQRGPITRSTSPMALKRYLIHNDTTLEEFKTFLLPELSGR
jgi:peptidoglycan/xylan/chitin deacetylase (PgdA/CDA1 family)